MMDFIAIFFSGLAIVHYSSAQEISPATTSAYPTSTYTTSSTIFLPSALFNPLPASQTFTGQVTTTGSTIYYSLTYELGLSFFNPSNAPHTVGGYDNLYVFSASAAGTQYVLPHETTVSCSPTHGHGTALCMTFYPGVAATSRFDGPSYWQIDNAESSVYLAYFTSTEPFPAATTTAAALSTSSSPTAAPSSTAWVTLSPQAKLGIGLGVSLGICACALLGLLLLLRHRRHKQQSRIGRTSILAGPNDVAGELEDKAAAESGDGDGPGDASELHAMEVSNELEGSLGEGREELA